MPLQDTGTPLQDTGTPLQDTGTPLQDIGLENTLATASQAEMRPPS